MDGGRSSDVKLSADEVLAKAIAQVKTTLDSAGGQNCATTDSSLPQPEAASQPVGPSSIPLSLQFGGLHDTTPTRISHHDTEHVADSLSGHRNPSELAALATAAVGSTMSTGIGIECVSPHPMLDTSSDRSLQNLHQLTPIKLSLFEATASCTSMDPFVTKEWVIPHKLRLALEEIDEQANVLQAVRSENKDAVKSYIRLYCAADDRRHKNITPFNGDKSTFINWCTCVAEDIKDRGQSEKWQQMAYITENVLNKLLTKDIRLTVKGYDKSFFASFRTLITKMATTFTERFAEGHYVNQIVSWQWPRDHLSYTAVRVSLEKLMDTLVLANGDGQARVSLTAFRNVLVNRMPREFRNPWINALHQCKLFDRVDFFGDPNNIIRFILNMLYDRELWMAAVKTKGGQSSGGQGNTAGGGQDNNNNHKGNGNNANNRAPRNGGGDKPKDKPLAVVSTADVPVLYNKDGHRVDLFAMLPQIQASFWKC